MPCSSRWISRNAFGRAGVADDYVLQIANRTAGGYKEDETDGGSECHLALGGKGCMLPTVLPAWTRPSSGALSFLHGQSPEEVTAPSASASLAAAPRRGRAEKVDVEAGTEAGAGAEAEADGLKEGRACHPAGRLLALDMAGLRAFAARRRDSPMLELTTNLRAAESAADAPLRGHALRLRCRGADRIDEAQLLLAERRRLDELRAACPAYFAVRGSSPGQLDWLHRKRLRPRTKSKSGQRKRMARQG